MDTTRAAMAPCGPGRVLAVARRSHIPFASGELERLAAFAGSAAAVVALKR
jgi:hypothetical protein